MRAIKSFIKEALLERDEPSDETQDGQSSEQDENSLVSTVWEIVTSSGSSLAAWVDEKAGRAKTEIDKAEDSAGKTAEEAEEEFESFVERGMSKADWQLFSSEEAMLTQDKREQIRKDVDNEFKKLGSGAGVIIEDNDVINFRYGIKNLLQKDFEDAEINYPYRTAFYIIAYQRGIYTFGDAFSNIMETTASTLRLPVMLASLAFEEPAGGDPSKDTELTNTEIVGLSGLGVFFGGPILKFLGHLAGEIVTEAGIKKLFRLLPGDFLGRISRTRVQSALKDEASWKLLTNRLRSETYAASGKKSIVDVMDAWFRSYEDGISYSNFVRQMLVLRTFAKLFVEGKVMRLVVNDLNPEGALSQRAVGVLNVNIKDLVRLSTIDEVEEFVFEFARRFLYISLQESGIKKAAKGIPGTAEKFLQDSSFAAIFKSETDEIADFNRAKPEFIEFADFLDAVYRTKDINNEANDFATMLASRAAKLSESKPGLIDWEPSTPGTPLPATFRISTRSSQGAAEVFDASKKGVKNMLSLSEDLAEPAAQLTMLSKFFRFARSTVVGKLGLVRAIKLALASAGVIEFATILAGDDEAITLLQSTIIATGAVIRRDAYDAFVDIRQAEPDINIMGIAKNVGIATRIEGKFQDADKALSNLLRRPVGDPENDLGLDDMMRIEALYEEALKGTVETVMEKLGWIAGAAAGARVGLKASKMLPPILDFPVIMGGSVVGSAAGGIGSAAGGIGLAAGGILGAAGIRYAEEMGGGSIDVPSPSQDKKKDDIKESIDLKLLKTLIRNIL